MRPLALVAAALLAGAAGPALACPSPAGVVRTIFADRPADLPQDTQAFGGRWSFGASEPPVPGWGVPVGWLEQADGRRLAVYSPLSSCHHDFRRDFGAAEVWIVGAPLVNEGRVVGVRARGRGRNGEADWSGRRR